MPDDRRVLEGVTRMIVDGTNVLYALRRSPAPLPAAALRLFDLSQLGFGGGELLLEQFQFVRIVHLLFRPRQLLPQGLDSLLEHLRLFLRFLIHGIIRSC